MSWESWPSAQISPKGNKQKRRYGTENGGFGCSRGPSLMVGGDRVQKLSADTLVEGVGMTLNHSEAEVHVAEELAFGGRREQWCGELKRSTDVVK